MLPLLEERSSACTSIQNFIFTKASASVCLMLAKALHILNSCSLIRVKLDRKDSWVKLEIQENRSSVIFFLLGAAFYEVIKADNEKVWMQMNEDLRQFQLHSPV